MVENKSENWFVYILRCNDNSYYTGITNNLAKRIKTHNSGKGSYYTKTHRPVKIVYFEVSENKSLAIKREIEIKSWKRKKKENLIRNSTRKVKNFFQPNNLQST